MASVGSWKSEPPAVPGVFFCITIRNKNYLKSFFTKADFQLFSSFSIFLGLKQGCIPKTILHCSHTIPRDGPDFPTDVFSFYFASLKPPSPPPYPSVAIPSNVSCFMFHDKLDLLDCSEHFD